MVLRAARGASTLRSRASGAVADPPARQVTGSTRGAGAEVGPAASFEEVRADWDRLADLSGSVFSTWEWAATWWDLYGRGRRLALLPVRDPAGRVIAILPLYAHDRRAVRIARFVGHEGGDEIGPVCAPEDRAVVGALLASGARAAALDADVLLAESLPGVDWERHVPGTILRRTGSPVTNLAGLDWEAFLDSLSRKLRREITHGERRLRREHAVQYRVTVDPERLQADLDTFFGLHRARFPNGSSLIAREAFYRRFATLALERGWLRLSFLELDGKAAASRLDLRFGAVHFAYNAGRDPSLGRDSVGLILRAMTIRDALADGAREYRLLRGSEPYKYRLATGDRESLTVVVPATLTGRIVVKVAAALAGSGPGRGILNRAIAG